MLRASENDERPRLWKVSKNNSLPGKKRHCDYDSDMHSTGGPSSTKTGTDRSLKAKRSLQGTSSPCPTRNEHSTLKVELEHCLPPDFLDGCQSRNQRPGYTKNGILKAMLMYHKHQAAVIEKQRKIIEAQAAKNAALEEESNARLMQRVQQCVAYEESRC